MRAAPEIAESDQKILVVDDEIANLQKLHRTLHGRYTVLAAKSGGEALGFLENESGIAVIITDQRMPDMTGLELLSHTLESHPHLVRIILTGFTDVEVLMEAINTCRVFRYLVKPWEPGDLLMTVERGLETYRLALENERFRRELIRRERLARELEIAREIQRYILPAFCPPVPGYEVSVEYQPALEVGGDLYDFDYRPESGILRVVVGDVSGKSIPAALYGAVFSGHLRALFAQPMQPAESLAFLNASLVSRTPRANYIAVSFISLDLATGCVTLSNAGLTYPYLVHHGRVDRLDLPGPPLGLLSEATHEETRAVLQAGDTLIIASDGCTEATDQSGDEFGEERFTDCIERHHEESTGELVRSLYREMCLFTQRAENEDDITILALRRQAK